MASTPIEVRVRVMAVTPLRGVPVLIVPIEADEVEPDVLRDVAEQIRAQVNPDARVIVVNGLVLDAPNAEQAMHLLRALMESYDTEPVAAFAQQFDVVRQFVAAVDTADAQDEDPEDGA